MVEFGVDQYPGVMPLPPGETVDLLHPESISHRLILACIVCPAIALIFCLIRLYTVRSIVRKVHPDDCERSQTLSARGTVKITAALEEKPWVRAANVALLTQSATVDFDGEHNAEELVKIIDAGFQLF